MTSLGNINVQLAPTAAPNNVANFLSYVNSGAYTNSIIHRSVPGFIIQGGGYTVSAGPVINAITTQAPVVNEFNLSNVRGTLAMAKLSNSPNSATSQWFFNLADNASTLDTQNGGSTVIGTVSDSQSLAVMDAIAALPDASLQSPFDQLPVINYTSGASIQQNNFVVVSSITQTAHPAFFTGEVSLGNDVYNLTFPNGTNFGYYAYLSDPRYIYHYDLGFEYTFDANDGSNGIYLYDFASSSFFYTSPSFPFPYLYDFSLQSVVYYYPNTTSAGHYTSSPRYFYEFRTGTIITK